ncbi:FAD-binding dehydrogenase [Saccharothrix algeriensis]|uniref:FAD-binding dehydrogenase n=1 Tax=Saccharothrix algeriensis TaxID=173560 RepID=A0A8T8HT32_9PSEU|nr:FAD-binding dehydrogenase [Saccharothrix algeriensis]MBM7813083.1 putative oxidoreductase [Saccharothrix algeriensis]QTR01685.1 FAD-binding dehydrogenase [Saccharothrix algeriensis]
MAQDADVIVVGGGLAGLVATAELADAGRRVILLDQEPEASLGGQAFWSFGGLFLVDTPEQRRLKVRDSAELALQDWLGSAAFDRDTDHWPRRWAEAYVDFAAGEKRSWLHAMGVRWFSFVQWAERGGYLADGHGNSVPRFHVTWGTGPALVEPFERRVRAAVAAGLVRLRFRHRVTGLTTTAGRVDGVRGEVLEPSAARRGEPSSRTPAGDFELRAQAVVVTSGGIGGNHELVRRNWPARLGSPPEHLLSGVPDHVDGRMLQVVQGAGGAVVNEDRMWHYPEGIANHTPVWSRHGIRILPGPSSLWLDATGRRLPVPLFPGFDALGALEHIVKTGHGHSWFVLNRRIIGKEFALSGSEQNPDLTDKDVRQVLRRALPGAVAPVERFARRSEEFIIARTVPELVAGMNKLVGADLVDAAALEALIVQRDRQVTSGLGKDMQVNAMREARRFLTDKLIRVVEPHPLLDPKAGPLIAVRLSVLTRKTLGGLHTDLSGRVLTAGGTPLDGVYAAGEAAGFGGGGVHGYRALEGTFLGGCLFSGRVAGRAAARDVG